MRRNPFRYFKTSPEIIRRAEMMYVRFPLSLRNVEGLLHKRGINVCHKAVRHWVDRFGIYLAHKTQKSRSIDHEGEVLESFFTKTRDKDSALNFL